MTPPVLLEVVITVQEKASLPGLRGKVAKWEAGCGGSQEVKPEPLS